MGQDIKGLLHSSAAYSALPAELTTMRMDRERGRHAGGFSNCRIPRRELNRSLPPVIRRNTPIIVTCF